MPRDVPHVTSWHVMSRHFTSCHVMSRDVPHVTSWHVMSRHVISRNVTSCRVTSCHVMSHLAPSCHVMSYHFTSYHIESRGTVTRPTLHCQLTSSTRNQFKLSMTVFVGCPEGCRYNTASAVYDLVLLLLYGLSNGENISDFRWPVDCRGQRSRSNPENCEVKYLKKVRNRKCQ